MWSLSVLWSDEYFLCECHTFWKSFNFQRFKCCWLSVGIDLGMASLFATSESWMKEPNNSAHCICARMLDFNRQPVDIAHLWNFFPLWMLNEAAKPLHAEHLLSWWTLSDGIIILFHKDLWIVLPFSFFTKVRIQGWEQKSQDFLKRSWLSLKKTNKKTPFQQ